MRMSTTFAGFAVTLLIAAPWVYLSVRWPVYLLGVTTLAAAVIFRLLND